MRARILDFVQALRARDVEVSTAEALDAVTAVAYAGVEREVLREALAAALVKHEPDRPAFDALFDAMFPLIGADDESGGHRRRARGGGGAGARPGTEPGGDETRTRASRPTPERAGARDGATAPRSEPGGGARGRRLQPSSAPEVERLSAQEGAAGGRAARRHALLTRPFRELTTADVAEARELVAALGRRLRTRLARRARQARRGRLDFRRTIRAATSSGGVPVRPRFRMRRPARPDLVALCDVSGSVAVASDLLLGLLAPAADWFRRAHFFVYVDRLCPVSIEDGHVAPEGALDLHARSDLGRVLTELRARERGVLTRQTLFLVLGDARNNRLPPRVDVLRELRDRVQRLVWLVPEPRARWDTGDSVIGRYAPVCDALFECIDLAAVLRAVRATL